MIAKMFKKIQLFLLELLFPIECLNCGKEKEWLCQQCFNSIPLVNQFVCPICQRPSLNGATCLDCKNKTYLDGLIFATYYDRPLIKKLIQKMKYYFIKDVAEILAELPIKLIINSNLYSSLQPDLVIPIPLHRKKILERGFNQSEIIAQKIAQKFNWPLGNNIIARIKNTKSQTKLKKEKREQNIAGAFTVCDKKIIKNKNIILIDDVVTTGATLEEAAKVLKKSGAKSVWAITVAKG